MRNSQLAGRTARCKKHPDEVANKGCGDCGQVLGGDIQMNREGRGGMYQEIEVFKFLGQMLD